MMVNNKSHFDGTQESATALIHWMFPDIEADAIATHETLRALHILPGDDVVRNDDGSFSVKSGPDWDEIMGIVNTWPD